VKNKELQELLKQYDDDLDLIIFLKDRIIADVIGLNLQRLESKELGIDWE
jgi:hypothetical protein